MKLLPDGENTVELKYLGYTDQNHQLLQSYCERLRSERVERVKQFESELRVFLCCAESVGNRLQECDKCVTH